MASINIDYLIDQVRLELGDINPTTYKYLDEWVVLSLIAAVRTLSRRWQSKYKITLDGQISRNTEISTFEFTELEDGVVQQKDERLIVVQASLILLEGSLEHSAWDIGSWRDAELSVSNIESGKLRGDHIFALRNELDSILKPATKRLLGSRKNTHIKELLTTRIIY